MFKQILLLLCAVLVITDANIPAPRDLIDEVNDQVQQLDTLVRGEILKAHDDLNNLMTDFTTNSAHVGEDRAAALQQEYEFVDAQLQRVKDRGTEANVDISKCFHIREDAMKRLPQQFEEEIYRCVASLNTEALGMVANAGYIVDVVINKVSQLEYQVRQCGGDLLCVSPLVTEIQLDKIRLPQNIKTEVQAADNLMTKLKPTVADCAHGAVYMYDTTAYGILSSIIWCVNRELGV